MLSYYPISDDWKTLHRSYISHLNKQNKQTRAYNGVGGRKEGRKEERKEGRERERENHHTASKLNTKHQIVNTSRNYLRLRFQEKAEAEAEAEVIEDPEENVAVGNICAKDLSGTF